MSSRSDWSDRSRHSWWGRWHQEEIACMKINHPIFKDKDAKDAVTYQSWRWDLRVYWHAGCRDYTLLPYAIRSLQGYPGELVWSSGMDITLDDVFMILDEHYNNVKALDVLNEEISKLQMMDKETVLDWGICLSRYLQALATSFPDHFPPDWVAELKRDHFYGGLPKWLKVMVAHLKAAPQVRTYSDYLRAAREAKKEDSIELSRSSRTQTADGPPLKQGLLVSSPWENLRVTSHFWKSLKSAWHIWKKRMWVVAKTQRVMILVELRGWPRSLWSNWQGQWKMPKKMRNAVTIAMALNISCIIAPLWGHIEIRSS